MKKKNKVSLVFSDKNLFDQFFQEFDGVEADTEYIFRVHFLPPGAPAGALFARELTDSYAIAEVIQQADALSELTALPVATVDAEAFSMRLPLPRCVFKLVHFAPHDDRASLPHFCFLHTRRALRLLTPSPAALSAFLRLFPRAGAPALSWRSGADGDPSEIPISGAELASPRAAPEAVAGLPGDILHMGAPHAPLRLLVTAGVHGNEPCGVAALRAFLSRGAPLRHVRLTLAVGAPRALRAQRRFLDVNLNRVFAAQHFGHLRAAPRPPVPVDEDEQGDDEADDAKEPEFAYEVLRARRLAPWVSRAHWLLDLHSASALTPAFALPRRGCSALARCLAPFVVAGLAHETRGRATSLDWALAAGARGAVVECGQHADPDAAAAAARALDAFVGVFVGAGAGKAEDVGVKVKDVGVVLACSEAVPVREGFRWARGAPPKAFCQVAPGERIAEDAEGVIRAPGGALSAWVVMPTALPFVGEEALFWAHRPEGSDPGGEEGAWGVEREECRAKKARRMEGEDVAVTGEPGGFFSVLFAVDGSLAEWVQDEFLPKHGETYGKGIGKMIFWFFDDVDDDEVDTECSADVLLADEEVDLVIVLSASSSTTTKKKRIAHAIPNDRSTEWLEAIPYVDEKAVLETLSCPVLRSALARMRTGCHFTMPSLADVQKFLLTDLFCVVVNND